MAKRKMSTKNLLSKYSAQQNNQTRLIVALSVLGIILFLVIAFFIPLKNQFLSLLYPKPPSYASAMLFSDEFNGTTLNPVWTNGVFWWNDGLGGSQIGEQETYMPSQATIANGYLNLTAINQPSSGRPFTSGMVSTSGIQYKTPVGFSFLYGYAEARIKLPPGNGMWPAFWLWPADYKDPPEIDILENLGKQINTYYQTLHQPNNGNQVQFTFTGPDLSADFHVYAVDWQPDYLDYYFDGVKIAHYSDTAHYFSKAMYPILNLALGGSWAGPVDTGKLPATMQVDWIHIYQTNPYLTSTPAPTLNPTPTPAPTNIAPPTPLPTVTPAASNTPAPIPVPQTGLNLMQNGSFEGSLSPWILNMTSPASASLLDVTDTSIDGKYSASINVKSTSSKSWYAQFRQDKLSIIAGKTYTLTFWAKASRGLRIDYVLQSSISPYGVLFDKTALLSTTWQQYSYTYKATVSSSTIFAGFNLANTKGTIWIDNVSLISN